MQLEWLGGRYTVPDGSQTEVVLWLELPTGLLIAAQVIDPSQPMTFGDMLSRTMSEPAEGPPRRPSRIRVGTDALARELRRQAAGIPVIVAPVPELEDTLERFVTHMIDGGTEEFVRAAHRLREAAPWRRVYDSQVMRVDIPDYEVEGAALSIVGAAGPPALVLFRSPADYDAFASGRRRKSDREPVMRCLSFATDNGEPGTWSLDAAHKELAVTAYDLRILTACALAFVEFFSRHAGLFDDDAPPRPVTESITGEDGVTVTITAPYPKR